MTPEQKESLDSIKATYALLNHNEVEVGYFRTEDLRVTLEFLEELEQKITCVKEDLGDIKEYLETNGEDSNSAVMELVDSSLMFLNNNDF